MYSTLFSLAVLTATAISGVFADFTITSPQLTQCGSSVISWSGGIPPYHLVVVDANDPCGDAILELGEIKGNSYKWSTQLPTNAMIKLYVEDSGINDAWSGIITVQKSNDQSCLPQFVRSYYNITAPTSSVSSSSVTEAATTLVIPASHYSMSSVPTGLVPIGAANAGTNPLSSGASSIHRVGTPIASVATLLAALFLVL